MSLLALPLECLEKILGSLSTRDVVAVGCSCRALQRILSSSSRLWRKVTFSHVTSEHEEVVRSVLKRYGHWAYSAHISATLPHGKVVKLLASCKACTSLSLRFQSARNSCMSPVQLKVLFSQMMYLKSVEMWSRTSTATCLADVTLLISGFVNLEEAILHLNGVHPVTLLRAWISLKCRPRRIFLHTDYSQDDILHQILHVLKGLSVSMSETSIFTCCMPCTDPVQADLCKPEIQVSLGTDSAPFMMAPLDSLAIPVKGSCSLIQTTRRTIAVFSTEAMPESCKELVALNISGSVGVLQNLEGLQSVVLNCLDLKFIDVSGIPVANTNVVHFWKIVASSSLTHLTVSNCLLSSASSSVGQCKKPLQETHNDDALALCSRLTSLHALELRCCNVAAKKLVCLSCASFSDCQLAKVQVFSSLSYLACYTSSVKPHSLKSILSECRALRYLRFEHRSMQLQAGCGSLCMPEPAPGLCASLTQVCIVNTALTLSDDFCATLGRNGRLTHIFLLIKAMSLKAIEQMLRGNRRLVAVQIMLIALLGKEFRTFVQRLSEDLKDYYAVKCGHFTIKDNCVRQTNPLSAMTVDIRSNLGNLWMLAP